MSGAPIVAAIETGGTKLLYRVATAEGETLGEGRFETAQPETSVALLAKAIRDLLPRNRELAAVGIASFGPIGIDPASPAYGRMLTTTKPGWGGYDLRGAIGRALDAPIALDTDANAAALAEQAIGAGRGERSVAYVTVGTGIGGGLAMNGVTFKGSSHPEIGHVRLVRSPGDHAASTCPFHADCAEGLIAGPALGRRLAGAPHFSDTPELLDLAADYLAQLCATITLAWSPDCIVVGGGVLGVTGLFDRTRAALHAQLGTYGGADALDPATYLRRAALENAGLEGALLMARTLAMPRDD
ncbi:ROK family protein [Sphingopyxis sp. J-6]|uniref:ROK family protein n=1 Tax=Sphingopyxis sp. J-6 TaxID=3122054 RepID=UPI003983EB8D